MHSSSISSDTSLNMSTSILNSSLISNHFSFVHYNVQSLASKLDILYSELCDFDVLAFSETWLSPATETGDLQLSSFAIPERKDRAGDNHGGVILYVKENLYYHRRLDLEIGAIECIWIELILKQKHVLFGLFYRPPNSDALYYNSVEDSLHLAVDTGINDIIITGDFNFNMLNPVTARKIRDFCDEFSLCQSIQEPTHFTESSSSLIDILLVKDVKHLIKSGVGEPFLQNVRFYCPIYEIFNFSKPKKKSYMRHIWMYDRADFDLLRQKAADFDWASLRSDDISIYANNITEKIFSLSKECIPNKQVRIRPSEPVWMTSIIRHLIRKRKRAFRKAKLTDTPANWKNLENCVIKLFH